MSRQIYLLKEANQLVAMREAEYDSEALLQELLAHHPGLLAGEQMDRDEPRRWLLITREMDVPCEDDGTGRWSLDHLFLDQEAIPTLVEVKRSTDTRIRREVVGQMLDYASNAVVYWPMERVRRRFEARCEKEDLEPELVLSEFLGDDRSPEEFWTAVKTNLQAGRVRMVFVADIIPEELKRIVEFLNGQMDPAEVLAVEIKQYVAETMRTLVPRVMGLTAAAVAKKPGRSQGNSARAVSISEADFLLEMKEEQGAEAARFSKILIDHCLQEGLNPTLNRNTTISSFVPSFSSRGGRRLWPLTLQTSGKLILQMYHLKRATHRSTVPLFAVNWRSDVRRFEDGMFAAARRDSRCFALPISPIRKQPANCLTRCRGASSGCVAKTWRESQKELCLSVPFVPCVPWASHQ